MNPSYCIREVWFHNVYEEFELMKEYLIKFPIVAIDTEFPGFLKYTPKGVSEKEFYECLRFNVDRLSILQLGLTLIDDEGNIGMTWEINFTDFDTISDMEGVTTLNSFLRNKGFNFKRLSLHGVTPEEFAVIFLPICSSGLIKKWITFHGFYDIAYLMKLLYINPMPNSMLIFAITAQLLLGTIVDLKHMARYCHGLMNGDLGLKRLAKLLRVSRVGIAHFAGSDSLLTACVYAKIKIEFRLQPNQCDGFLYGLPHRIFPSNASLPFATSQVNSVMLTKNTNLVVV